MLGEVDTEALWSSATITSLGCWYATSSCTFVPDQLSDWPTGPVPLSAAKQCMNLHDDRIATVAGEEFRGGLKLRDHQMVGVCQIDLPQVHTALPWIMHLILLEGS